MKAVVKQPIKRIIGYKSGTVSSVSGVDGEGANTYVYKDIYFRDKHYVTIGTNSVWTDHKGDFIIEGANVTQGVTVNGNITVRELVMSGSSDLTINPWGAVTATGSTSNSPEQVETTGSGLVVVKTSNSTSGSFIAKNITSDASNPINMKFERVLDATNANSATEWTLVSVPVVGENTDDIEDALASGSGDNAGKRAIGTFNNDTGAYVYYDDGASVDLAVGTGLAVTPDTEVTQVDFQGTYPLGFTQVAVSAGSDETYGEWNLVGNPFPAYYFLTTTAGTNNFITDNTSRLADLAQGVYAWDGVQWSVQSESAGSKNYIAPGEAFFVKFKTGNGTNMNFQQSRLDVKKGANFNAGLARGASENKREATLK